MPTAAAAVSSFADFALVLPGFSREFARQPSRLPSLERLLGYSRDGVQLTRSFRALNPWQQEILQALRIADAARYPSASLTWLGAGGANEAGLWLHAQPAALSVSTQGLTLQSLEKWSTTSLEAVESYVRDHLRASRLQWRVLNEQAFIHGANILNVETTSAEQALNQDLRDVLPTGQDAVALRRLMTDLQMLLHDKPIEGFNSLWLWGGGFIPERLPGKLPTLYANDDYVRGIYSVHGATAHCGASPLSAEEILSERQPAVIVERDIDFERLERRWLAPIVRAIDAGKIHSVELYLDGLHARIERSWYRRWFARPRPLAELPT